jgi:hypothetical protein
MLHEWKYDFHVSNVAISNDAVFTLSIQEFIRKGTQKLASRNWVNCKEQLSTNNHKTRKQKLFVTRPQN